MRILHFISRLGAGGAERVLISLMREQLAVGHEVHWCAMNGGHTHPDRLVDMPVPEIMHFSFSRLDPVGRKKWSGKVRELVNEVVPDIVHTHLWPVSRFVEQSLPGPSPPHVIHVHDTLPWLWENDWRSRLTRWQTNRIFQNEAHRTRFLAVSQSTLEQTQSALAFDHDRFLKVHNPVDPILALRLERIKRNKNGNPIRIGTASRLEPSKGIDILINSISHLQRQGLPVEGLIAGDGSDRSRLESIAEGSVRFLGNCPDIGEVLAGFDIFVLPSLTSEGLSIAQLEAMASGLPVVVTDVAGAKEATRDGLDGFVVAPGNRDQMCDAIKKLVLDFDLRKKFGSLARERVANEFTAKRMMDQVENVYGELVSRSITTSTASQLTSTPV